MVDFRGESNGKANGPCNEKWDDINFRGLRAREFLFLMVIIRDYGIAPGYNLGIFPI